MTCRGAVLRAVLSAVLAAWTGSAVALAPDDGRGGGHDWVAARIAEDLAERTAETSLPGIATNVERLGQGGSAAHGAMVWLSLAGRVAVPALEGALGRTDERATFLALSLLGDLGSPESAPAIIELVRPHLATGLFVKPGFLALAALEPGEPAILFALEQLDPTATALARRGALALLAAERDDRGAERARLLAAGGEAQIQAAAIFYLARLGESDAAELALQWIEAHPGERTDGQDLLRAAAELLPPVELERRATHLVALAGLDLVEALRLSRFRLARGPERSRLAVELLRESEHPWDRRTAIRSLLDAGEHDLLAPFLNSEPAYVYPLSMVLGQSTVGRLAVAEAGRRGLRLTATDVGYRLRPPG